MWKYFTRHQQVNITDKYYFSIIIRKKMIENKGISNLIIKLPTMGAQGSRPNCTKSTEQHVYTPNQLRSIGKQYKSGNGPGILPFGAIRQIRDLCLNKKKHRKSLHRHSFKQIGINNKNLAEVNYDDRDGDDSTKYLRIGTVNTRSIKSKQELVLETINRYNLDLLVVTETWLRNTYEDQTWVQSSEINRNNLTIKTHNGTNKWGGGLALIHSREYKVDISNGRHRYV